MMKSKLENIIGPLRWGSKRVIGLGITRLIAICSMASASLSQAAFAGGSIVINASAPASELVYREDTGTTKSLKVTWTDIQVIDAMRRFMAGKFGASGADQPFYINRKTSKVSYFDPTTESYSEVSFQELLGTR